MSHPYGPQRGSGILWTCCCLVVVIAGLKAASGLLVPVLSGVFLALISLPAVRWLERHGAPAWLSATGVFVAVAIALLVLSVILTRSIGQFQANLPAYEDRLDQLVTHWSGWLVERGVSVDPAHLVDQLDSGTFTRLLGNSLSALSGLISNLILVVLTMAFVLGEAAVFPSKVRQALGDRINVEHMGDVLRDLHAYLAVKSWTSLATGIAIGGFLWIVGVDFPVLWGLVAFLLNYIPTLGSIIAAIPAVLLAFVQFGAGWAIVVAAWFVVVNTVIGSVLEPMLMGRRLGLSTLVVFLSLVFWGWVWGPVGMVLSVPLTMMVRIMLLNSSEFRPLGVMLGTGREQGG